MEFLFSLRWVDEGLKKCDIWKQNSSPKKVQVYVLLIWFRIYLGKVYHLHVHCCFGSLKKQIQ